MIVKIKHYKYIADGEKGEKYYGLMLVYSGDTTKDAMVVRYWGNSGVWERSKNRRAYTVHIFKSLIEGDQYLSNECKRRIKKGYAIDAHFSNPNGTLEEVKIKEDEDIDNKVDAVGHCIRRLTDDNKIFTDRGDKGVQMAKFVIDLVSTKEQVAFVESKETYEGNVAWGTW